MKKLLLAFCLIALGMANAQAAPANDDLETFLSKHNVVSQIQQAGDSMLASASELVGNAMGFLGVRYRYGGTTPETGLIAAVLFGLRSKKRWAASCRAGLPSRPLPPRPLPKRNSSRETWCFSTPCAARSAM